MAERVERETAERVGRETAERVERETAARVERETAARVERETTERLVAAVLRGMLARFGGDLPADFEERLRNHAQAELCEIVARVATAGSAAEALDISPGIAPR